MEFTETGRGPISLASLQTPGTVKGTFALES